MATALVGQIAAGVHVLFTRPDGSAGNVDPTNPPTWASSDDTILAISNVAIDADNMGSTCDVTTIGEGTARVACTPDVDLDPAVQNFITVTSEDVTVAARPVPLVTGGNIAFSPFVDVTPAPAAAKRKP